MLLPSEVESKALLPALRAVIVNLLVKKYELPQRRVAEALGITQPAVSNYLRMVRGKMRFLSENNVVQEVAEEIAKAIVEGEKEERIRGMLQAALVRLRRERVLCIAHKTLEPVLDVDSCHICD
ncbi:MAG: hypothetical protein QXW60_03085 [Nitrososphaerota archaeon]